MNKTLQTKLGNKVGNCYAACLASLFERPIESIPDFTSETDNEWNRKVDNFLASIDCYRVRVKNDREWRPQGYHLAAVDSPHGPWLHEVVCFNGEIRWDPHPSQDSYSLVPVEWEIIIPLNPARGGGR